MEKVKLIIEGGNASAAPPVGAILGSKGINIRDFCLEFNNKTQDRKGKLLRVEVIAGKKLQITIKGTPTTALIKEKANIKKGSGQPNRDKVGTLTMQQVREIAQEAQQSLTGHTPEARDSTIIATAKNMGITIAN